MKKSIIYLVLLLAFALFSGACSSVNTESNDTAASENEVTGEEVIVDAGEQEPAEPEHSELYLPEYSQEQIIEYFEEIALNMEYADGEGDTSLVQKWISPIRYRIYGSPTDEDLRVLEDLFNRLNEIEGFPGIYEASDDEYEELTISFLDYEDFYAAFSTFLNYEEAYGATQFWYYTDTNEIYTANVGYRTDIDQTTRTSILLEEIVNVLGTSDTVLREDSVVYQYSNDNLELSDVDWIILKLLYNPAISCGSDYEECRESICELYY